LPIVTRRDGYAKIQHAFESWRELKLKSMRTHYNLRKYSFSIRIINIWNSLSEHVVTANTIDCFKTRLDKFWNSQDVKFDYKQNLTGLHNRSMIT